MLKKLIAPLNHILGIHVSDKNPKHFPIFLDLLFGFELWWSDCGLISSLSFWAFSVKFPDFPSFSLTQISFPDFSRFSTLWTTMIVECYFYLQEFRHLTEIVYVSRKIVLICTACTAIHSKCNT